MSLLLGQCQTLAAQLVFTTVRSPRRHPNLHRLFSATVESRLVFIASFVTGAWRSVGRHAMPQSLHVRRSLCTVLAQLFSPSGGCSWRSLSCFSVTCRLRRNPGRAGRNDASVDSPTDGEKKKIRRQSQSKTIKVVISYAINIPIQAITDALRGQYSEHFQEALGSLTSY
ncbi:hypothetical protein PIB30_078683 [Stylosanthes scabra]|uniref:Uncharacterized protein n=1 Tax=Stylosanthes scabra TaxID=79078 RepID=A0ABU6WP95_9FABA|nr:hypothetical protein [Stylosanthes scabra]